MGLFVYLIVCIKLMRESLKIKKMWEKERKEKEKRKKAQLHVCFFDLTEVYAQMTIF